MDKDLDSIVPLNRIRVSERKEANQNSEDKQEQQPQQPPRREEILPGSHTPEDMQWWGCQIEIGSLLIEKRNIELALYTHLKDAPEKDSMQLSEEKTLSRIRQRIAELERRLIELDHGNGDSASGKTGNIELSQANLEQLSRLYDGYLELTDGECRAIEDENYDNLDSHMQTKQELMERIAQVRDSIDFPALQALEDGSEKKIKASQVLSDINLKMRQILDKENLNSVELQNRKEAIRVELSRRNVGTRAITHYAVSEHKPRFIDTTK